MNLISKSLVDNISSRGQQSSDSLAEGCCIICCYRRRSCSPFTPQKHTHTHIQRTNSTLMCFCLKSFFVSGIEMIVQNPVTVQSTGPLRGSRGRGRGRSWRWHAHTHWEGEERESVWVCLELLCCFRSWELNKQHRWVSRARGLYRSMCLSVCVNLWAYGCVCMSVSLCVCCYLLARFGCVRTRLCNNV